MKKRSGNATLPVILLLLLAAAAGYGLVHLFLLRFETGAMLPPYSSLRADPLGTKALYDSLDQLPEIRVSRNYQPYAALDPGPAATIFLLGIKQAQTGYTGRDILDALENTARKGGRVVIAFLPETHRPEAADSASGRESASRKDNGQPSRSGNAPKKETPAHNKPELEKKDQRLPDETRWPMNRRWGFETGLFTTPDGAAKTLRAVRQGPPDGLPSGMSWHTALYFKNPDPRWRVIYVCQEQPVVMERAFGSGSIVLCADSFLFSNEALRSEPLPDLLAWLTGPPGDPDRQVVFEETHFGITEKPGVAALARRYRLQGLFFGLVVLALLFVWKNAFPLTPVQDADPDDGVHASRRDYVAGMASLLKRNIPPGKITGVCLVEWQKTGSAISDADAETRLNRAKSILNEEKDPVSAWSKIKTVLTEGKKSWR